MSETQKPSAGSASDSSGNAQQFGRVCTLLVSNKAGKALDLSALRIKFAVKRSGVMTPNTADILVYNLDYSTAQLIKKEFTTVVLQAGYVGNYGVIFKGNIKWAWSGRESGTDTVLNIVAGDGDSAYNFAVVNKTLAAGSSPNDRLNAALTSMYQSGVGQSYVGALPASKLPRGKVMYGNARDYLKDLADTHNFTWSIQDGQMVFINQGTYLPGTAVVLTTKTGLIGQPKQTIEGIEMKCLLNPKLKIHGRVKIDNKSVQTYKLNPNVPGSPANTPVPLTNDGVYYILVAEHVGDTRGTEWYTNLQTLNIDPSSNPLNSVKAGSGI